MQIYLLSSVEYKFTTDFFCRKQTDHHLLSCIFSSPIKKNIKAFLQQNTEYTQSNKLP